jgi:hypothetical protein
MTPEELERERRESAAALERVVAKAATEPKERTPVEVLGATIEVETPKTASPAASSRSWSAPPPPDLKPVNESWSVNTKGGGLLASMMKTPEAQVKFNSDQVQLDNAVVSWIAAHFEATHRHYDGVIGELQRRLDDADTRHRELERELVRHVHDMARRIDVVLGEGEKGRVSHESALRALREKLRELEEKVR